MTDTTGILVRYFAVVSLLAAAWTSDVLAQVVPGADNPFSIGADVVKVGLGVASFIVLVWFLKWMATELTAARVSGLKAQESAQEKFLGALDKQHQDHGEEMRLLREHNERQVVRLHEAIDDSVRGKNGGR